MFLVLGADIEIIEQDSELLNDVPQGKGTPNVGVLLLLTSLDAPESIPHQLHPALLLLQTAAGWWVFSRLSSSIYLTHPSVYNQML